MQREAEVSRVWIHSYSLAPDASTWIGGTPRSAIDQFHIRQMAANRYVYHLHFAVSCSTWGKAVCNRSCGSRQDAAPAGLPPTAAEAADNDYLNFVLDVFRELLRLGRHCAIVHPAESWLWHMPGILDLRRNGLFECVIDVCCFGADTHPGDRSNMPRARTRVLSTDPIFISLVRVCP